MLRIKTQLGSPKTGRDIDLWLIVENQSPFSFGLLNTRNTLGQPTGAVLAIATVTLI